MFYTDRQLEIMEFIHRYRRLRGIAPTLEEMARHFGVSKVTIYDHVIQLEKKKAISRSAYQARSLEIRDPDFLGARAEEAAPSPLCLSIRGRIAAGEGIEALENVDTIDLRDLLPQEDGARAGQGGERYALRVSGNSMIDDGIHDGDIVIVERRSVAEDGETVVAIIGDNQATLKRLYRDQKDGQKRYRLQPANETIAPIYVDRLEIRGVVVGVLRRFPPWRA